MLNEFSLARTSSLRATPSLAFQAKGKKERYFSHRNSRARRSPMSNLDKEMVHYTKLSAKWEGVQERVKVNQSIITTTSKSIKHLTWRFSNRRAEMWNSVQGSWDESWDGWQEALDFWQQCRTTYGYKIKLWVAKPTETQKGYKPGEQPNIERVSESVSVLAYNPELDLLTQWFRIEDWSETINYALIDNKMFPRQWTWQNPATSTIQGAKKVSW